MKISPARFCYHVSCSGHCFAREILPLAGDIPCKQDPCADGTAPALAGKIGRSCRFSLDNDHIAEYYFTKFGNGYSEYVDMKMMERGQITIPKKLRDRYGITPESELEFIPRPEGILLVKRAGGRSPFRKLFGILNDGSDTDAYIEAIRGR